MQINERGDLSRFPLLDPLPGEPFEETMGRSWWNQAEARINPDGIGLDEPPFGLRTVKQTDDPAPPPSKGRAPDAPLGHAGAGHHPRAKKRRTATAGKWS